MNARRVRLLATVAVAVLVVSLGTTLTAATNVPPSNAGITTVQLETSCSVQAAVAFHPKNLNRNGAGHQTLTVTVTFPGGVPPEADGASILGLTMSLPGGTQTISSVPGGGPSAYTFTRDDVLDLVGPVRVDVDIVVSGNLGHCTFSVEDTLKITG